MLNDVGLVFAKVTTARIGAMIEGRAAFDRRSARVVLSQYLVFHLVERADLIERNRTTDNR